MSKNKQLVITHADKQYTLEFTKDTVRKTENMGFKVRELFDYPANNIPILFRGAFLANHKWLQVSVIDEMYEDLPNKDELINKLYEMYNEPIQALVGLEEDANKGKKSKWEASF